MCPKYTAKILLLIAAYDNELGKSQSNMNISGHDNKDKSSRPGSVLSTNPSSKPANRANIFGDESVSKSASGLHSAIWGVTTA